MKDFLKKISITEDQYYGKETVGGYLDLSSLTSIPEGFNKNDFQNKDLSFLKWGKGSGTHILCDGRFSEVVSKKGNVWKLKDLNKDNEYYLISDGKDKYSHGNTIKQAKKDLIYKISKRDKSIYNNIDINKKLPFAECVEMYRVITGACSTGAKNFVETKNIKPKTYSVTEIARLTQGSYGHKEFLIFFNI